MIVFKYTGRRRSGALKKGFIEGITSGSVIKELAEQGVTVLTITESNQNQARPDLSNLSNKDKEDFLSEIANLIQSGVQLEKALIILSKTLIKERLQLLVESIHINVRNGGSLSKAITTTHQFSKLDCNLLELAEASGNLGLILGKLAESYQKNNELRRKIIQALIYPSIILFVCVGTILFVFNFVVPNMSGLFADVQSLPWYTEAIISLSDFFILYQMHMLVGFILFLISIMYYLASDTRKVKLINFFYYMPGMTSGILMVERIRYTSAMSLALTSGVKLEQSMGFARNALIIETLRVKLDETLKSVTKGEALSAALSHCEILDDMQLGYVEVGEEIGNITKVFEKIAKNSQEHFDTWVTKVTSLLEPVLILVMGSIVGGVVMIMLLSIMSIQDVTI
jgi:type II secretory pathway component PulF